MLRSNTVLCEWICILTFFFANNFFHFAHSISFANKFSLVPTLPLICWAFYSAELLFLFFFFFFFSPEVTLLEIAKVFLNVKSITPYSQYAAIIEIEISRLDRKIYLARVSLLDFPKFLHRCMLNPASLKNTHLMA